MYSQNWATLTVLLNSDDSSTQICPSLVKQAGVLYPEVCTCAEAKTQLSPGRNLTSRGVFELRIVCGTIVRQVEVIKIYRGVSNSFPQTADSSDVLRDLGLKLASLCQCDILEYFTVPTSISQERSLAHAYSQPLVFFTPKSGCESPSATDNPPAFPDTVADPKPEPTPSSSDPSSDAEPSLPFRLRWYRKDLLHMRPKFRRHAVKSELREQLGNPVKRGPLQNPLRFGYIYIMSNPSTPTHFKIGVTRCHPETRLREWRGCYQDAEMFACTNIEIPHAHRIEALIHAELAAHRRIHYCPRCLEKRGETYEGTATRHEEWFRISEKMSVQVVARWAKWMATQPYDNESGRLKPKWDQHLNTNLLLKYKPGANHEVRYESCWQFWVDRERANDDEDFSQRVEVVIKDEKPTWRPAGDSPIPAKGSARERSGVRRSAEIARRHAAERAYRRQASSKRAER